MISKVVYHNGLSLIDWFLDPSHHRYSDFTHFQVGFPILDPITLRGSILLFLDRGFLDDNEEHILYASPSDIGGLEFGHLDAKLCREEIEALKLNGSQFLSLIRSLEITEHNDIILHHRQLANTAILEDWFPKNLAEKIAYSCDRHMRIYEFRISSAFHACAEHIKLILAPNTMTAHLSKWKSSNVPVISYNPRKGIEHALKRASYVFGDRVL